MGDKRLGDDIERSVVERVHALGPYRSVREVVAALGVAAAVVVPRDDAWDYEAVRNHVHGPIPERTCWACGITRDEVRLIRHHIVQVQNGGSNNYRNLVIICQHCHASIHPWLPRIIRGTDFGVPLTALPPKDPK